MDRLQIFMAAAVVVLAALVGLWFGSDPEPPPPLRINTQSDLSEITVHVAGEVVSPGLVRIPPGSRVADAIAAAGGFTLAAEPATLNLAAPVADGQQVVVGGAGSFEVPPGKVSLNRASAAELEVLNGVGPVLASRIVAYREANGLFTSVEDLLDVSGIGEAKLATIRETVVVP